MNKNIKVLIVEDSETDTELLLRELKKGGCKTTHKRVETASAMKKALKEQAWDIILSDYRMPKFSAPDALKLLQSTNLDIPFIIVSGSVGEDVAVELLKSGAHDFVTKENLTRLIPAIDREVRDCKVRQEKRQKEQALAESEHRYQHLFANHPNPMWVYDIVTLKFVDVNNAAIEKYGYSREEFLAMTLYDIRPKKDYELLKKQIAKPRPIHQHSGEWRHLLKNGEIIFVEISSYLFEDEGRKLALVVANDITERKRAKEQLQNQYATLRGIIDSTDSAIFSIDTKYCYTSFNSTHASIMKSIYGVDIEVGKNMLEYMKVEEDRRIAKKNLDKALHGKSFSEEAFSGDQSLSRLYFSVSHHPIRNVEGEIIGVAVYSQNVTDRKRAEEEILRLNRLYSLLSNTNQAIVRMRDKQQILNEICKVAVTDGKFKMAWIGMVNSETNKLEIVASAGIVKDYLDNMNLDLSDKKRCDGPSEQVLKTGVHVVLNDIEKDEKLQALKECALRLGFRSYAKFPIKVFGKVIGLFNLYAEEIEFFHDDEIRLLDEMALDISFALESIDNEKKRKLAENALRESQQQYQTLAQMLPVGIFRTDANGSTTYVNPRWCQMSGLSADEALGNGWLKAVHPEDREKISKGWQNAIKSRNESYTEYRFVRPDGTISWVIGQAVPEKNFKNQVVGYVGTITDITERRYAEEALRKSEEKFRNLVENINDVFYVSDNEGKLLYCSPNFHTSTGYSLQDILGKSYIRMVAPVDRKRVVEHYLAETKSGSLDTKLEFRVRCKDGKIIWVEQNTRIVRDKSDKVLEYRNVVRDISERKLAEDKLIKSEEKYRMISENVSDIIWTIDLKTLKFTYVSPSVKKVQGFTPEEVMKLSLNEILTPDSYNEIMTRLSEEIETANQPGCDPDRIIKFEVQEVCKNGSFIFTETSVKFLRDENRIPIGVQGITRDITERKRTEEALRASESKFRAVAETSAAAIFIYQGEKFVYWNQASRLLTGYSDSEIEKLRFWELVHPDFREMIKERGFARQRGEQVPSRYEFKIITKTGEERWLDYAAGVIQFEGKPAALGVAFDITSRKQFELALQESERKLSVLMDNLPGMAYRCANDKYWTMKYVSQGCFELTGYEQDELIDNKRISFNDLIEESHRERLWNKWQEVLKNKEVFQDEYQINTADGKQKWVWEQGCGIYSDTGEVIALEGLIIDITERKHAVDALKKSEERYRSLFDRMMDGVYRSTHEGKFVEVNPAMVQMFGYSSREEMLNADIKNELYFAPSDRDSLFLNTGQERTEIFRMRRKDGSEIWVEDHGHYVCDEKGNVIFHEGILRDVTQRLTAEADLKKSEEKYRDLFTWAPVGIYQSSVDGKLLTVNKRLVDMLGYDDTSDLISRKFLNDIYYNEEERQKLLDEFDRSERGGLTNLEIRWKKKDGSPIWILLTSHTIRDANNNVLYYEGFVTDITERKHVEETMLKLNKAVESSGEVIFMTDPNGIFTYVNPEFTRLYGYEPDVVIGKSTPRILKSGVMKQDEYEVFWQTLLNKQVVKSELINKSKDGRLINVEVAINPVTDENKNIIGFLAIQKDITERKKAEEALKLQTTYFTQLFENSPSGIAFLDTNDRVMNVNKSFENIFQYTIEEIKGKSLTNLIVPEELAKESHSFSNRVVNGELMRSASVRKRRDGTRLDMIITGYPIMIEGKCVGIYAIFADVSDIKKLEEQVRQTQKLESIGTLAGGIAHDFNNILGIILGYTSLLESGVANPEKMKQIVNAISKAGHRGAGLVKQILTFARKTNIVIEPVNVNDSIKELIKMLNETFPKTITLSLDLDENIQPIIADHNQIHQALLNLSVNARDAILLNTPDGHGGSITYSTKIVSGTELRKKFPDAIDENYACISVTDSGSGMDAATLNRIFEPFFTTKEQGKGTGLGLAVVYGVVKSHRGFVDVQSELGVGTTFHLYFPLEVYEVVTDTVKEESETQVAGGSETILFVEDEELLQEVVKTQLTLKGYRVLSALNGEEAVEMYHKHQNEIAVILSDLGLPKLGGFEAFLRMKKINPRAQVILASGFFEPSQKSAMLEAGVEYFVQKPYKANEILLALRKLLDKK